MKLALCAGTVAALLAAVAVPFAFPSALLAQDPAHAKEFRLPTPGNGPGGAARMAFLTHRLGSDHAEGISVIDMNGDGFPDLLSGAYWYENPGADGGEWKQHQFRTVGIHNEFVSDCGEWVVDVDHDGLPDLVTAGWISNGVWWYKNPGPKATAAGAMWKSGKLSDSFDTEGGAFADINGDGKPDLILAHYNQSGLLWIDFSGAITKIHKLGDSAEDGHGVGVADINGDGKADILTTHGWFEQIDADAGKWNWHADWELGDTGFPIIGYDVNHDGKMDIIFGQGHGYGLYWLERTGSDDHRKWVRHTIDESFSQSHALAMVDVDGDGTPELITGKRYRGHSGGDPGSYDPLVVYAYKLPTAAALRNLKNESHKSAAAPQGMRVGELVSLAEPENDPLWERFPLSVNGSATAGTQFVAADFDKDGDIDLASAGKLGVHVYENLMTNKVPKAVREETQPLNRKWPFPGEGKEVPQEDGPAPK